MKKKLIEAHVYLLAVGVFVVLAIELFKFVCFILAH